MSRSNYAVSDFLVDRHPPNLEPFSGDINPRENTIAYGDRAVPKLIDVLKVPDLSLKEKQDTLRNLLSIDFAHQETKVNAVKQGLVESMGECIKDPDPSVRAQAIEVLGKIATMKQVHDRIVSADVLPLLLESLKDVATVCVAACNTIKKIASNNASGAVLIKYKAISYIVPLIESSPVKSTLTPSLEIFASLTSSSDDAILDALECSAIPPLQKILVKSPDLGLQCCNNIAKHMKGKDALTSANMLPTFAQFLHHSSKPVQQLALSVIMLLCIVVAAKRQAVEIPMLIDQLMTTAANTDGSYDSIDVQYAKSALKLICEYPVGRQEVEKRLDRFGDKQQELRSLFPKSMA